MIAAPRRVSPPALRWRRRARIRSILDDLAIAITPGGTGDPYGAEALTRMRRPRLRPWRQV
jgi:hypothetical protein